MATKTRQELRLVRHSRVRKRISGTGTKPRLSVYRSLKHIVAQVIDDATGTTVASASSQEKDLKAAGNAEGAKKVGEAVAKRAMEKGIKQVTFDRGGYRYHGRVANLAAGAREAGLEF